MGAPIPAADTKFQLAVGATVSLAFYISYAQLLPYRSSWCGRLQKCALLQLTVTYITAMGVCAGLSPHLQPTLRSCVSRARC